MVHFDSIINSKINPDIREVITVINCQKKKFVDNKTKQLRGMYRIFSTCVAGMTTSNQRILKNQ
jgi:hypothetical protein